jgi:hypothetical protein
MMGFPNHELWRLPMRAGIASVAAGGVVAAFTVAQVFAAPPAKLAPSDIQTTFFNGQPFTAATPSAGAKFKMTFTADGKIKRQPIGTGKKGEGTWKLSADGFCRTWKGAREECFTVMSAGANKWSVMKGSSVLATWSK